MDIKRTVLSSRLVVVDFDGTLVNTLQVDWERLKQRLRDELYEGAFFDGLDRDLRKLRKFDEGAFRFLCGIIAEEEERGYNGANEGLLSLLKQRKKPTAVFSSNTHTAIERILSRDEFSGFKPFIVGKEDVKRGKPDPEGFTVISRFFKLKCSVFIGDSEADFKAGKKGGVKTVSWENMKKEL